jgi:hypothetical protein
VCCPAVVLRPGPHTAVCCTRFDSQHVSNGSDDGARYTYEAQVRGGGGGEAEGVAKGSHAVVRGGCRAGDTLVHAVCARALSPTHPIPHARYTVTIQLAVCW